jgi:hypothetical protein
MRILLRGNVSLIEVKGSWEMESERGLICFEAETLLRDLLKGLCLIDANWFGWDCELIRGNLMSCLKCMSSACHVWLRIPCSTSLVSIHYTALIRRLFWYMRMTEEIATRGRIGARGSCERDRLMRNLKEGMIWEKELWEWWEREERCQSSNIRERDISQDQCQQRYVERYTLRERYVEVDKSSERLCTKVVEWDKHWSQEWHKERSHAKAVSERREKREVYLRLIIICWWTNKVQA